MLIFVIIFVKILSAYGNQTIVYKKLPFLVVANNEYLEPWLYEAYIPSYIDIPDMKNQILYGFNILNNNLSSVESQIKSVITSQDFLREITIQDVQNFSERYEAIKKKYENGSLYLNMLNESEYSLHCWKLGKKITALFIEFIGEKESFYMKNHSNPDYTFIECVIKIGVNNPQQSYIRRRTIHSNCCYNGNGLLRATCGTYSRYISSFKSNVWDLIREKFKKNLTYKIKI